jgi:hypothetical protein
VVVVVVCWEVGEGIYVVCCVRFVALSLVHTTEKNVNSTPRLKKTLSFDFFRQLNPLSITTHQSSTKRNHSPHHHHEAIGSTLQAYR